MSVDARVRAALTGTFFRLADLRKLVADAEANIKILEGELAALNDKISDPALDPWWRAGAYEKSELTKRNLDIAKRGLEKLRAIVKQRTAEAPKRKARLADAIKTQADVAEEIAGSFSLIAKTLAQLVQNAIDADRELAEAIAQSDEPSETPSSTFSLARKKPAPLTFSGLSDTPRVILEDLQGGILIDTTAPIAPPTNLPLGKLSLTNSTNLPVEIHTGSSNPLTSTITILPGQSVEREWPAPAISAALTNPALTVRAA